MRSSPEARQPVTPGGAAKGVFVARSLFLGFLLCALWFLLCPHPALAQGGSHPSTAPSPVPQSESKQNPAELASRDEPTTFKVNVKLVVVRAVVRDSQGHAVGNLNKEDFQVFDKGKPQVITQFEVEQPGALTAKARQESDENSSDAPIGEVSSKIGSAPAAPERFVAYLFDDVHLDFTDDRTKLHETLLRLQPRPISGRVVHDCPEISYYQADLIVNKHDPDARNLAIQEASDCGPITPQNTTLGNLGALVDSLAMGILSAGQYETRIALGSLKDVVRSVSRMPGQRSVVLVSPGFIAPDLQSEYIAIIDRAVRSQVIISTLDARGLYVLVPYGDASHQPVAPPGGRIPGDAGPPTTKTLIQIAAASADADLLGVLADGTGGVFFHNNNDFDEGFRRVAQAPEYSYVLAFAPQNLKLDGSFHSLKVTL